MAALLVGNSGDTGGYLGIIPHAHLLILQVFTQAMRSTYSSVIAALDAAIREGAQVVCVPMGGMEHSLLQEQAFARAADLGVAIVCSGGNEAIGEPFYPAGYPTCIGAAAVDSNGQLAAFSGFGDWVTTAAPGVDIPVATGDAGYGKSTGTAFSCAIAAGAVALMLQVNPELSVVDIKEILKSVGPRVPHFADAAPFAEFRLLDASTALQAASERRKPPDSRTRKKKGKAI
jgi:subtilisin family serine protease